MLGSQIGTGSGKRTGRRVLSVDGGFRMEVSFEGKVSMLGTGGMEVGTYTSATRPDGSLYGEGQGVLILEDGSVLTWKGSGVGSVTPGGAVSYRGAIYYSTAAPKFASLNKVVGVFEFEVDPEGNTTSKIWEWK